MITLKQFMETVSYRITEGGDYGWSCYGENCHMLTSWNGLHGTGGWSVNIVFGTDTQTVFEVDVCDYQRCRAYRMINPDYREAYDREAQQRGVNTDEAWDETRYIDLDVDSDWLEKARAIVEGQDYDTRVQIAVDFSDEDLLTYMKAAHERDITFNQLVEQAISQVIKQHQQENPA